MQRMKVAKTIVNIWMIGTVTMITIKTVTLGEGLTSKDEKFECSRWERRKLTVCLLDFAKSHQ
jgi:hypothetical protein